MSERVAIHLDGAALAVNVGVVRRHAPGARVIGVVKADAYGHGLKFVAGHLAGLVDGFAVATVAEGVRLRQLGIDAPAWVLSDFAPAADMDAVLAHDLTVVIHERSQLEAVRDASRPPRSVVVKIDSGMGRLGFDPAELVEVVGALRAAGINSVRVMSHLACADDPADPATADQLQCFEAAVAGLGLERSLANSAGVVAFRGAGSDWVRPGIMLYGASPVIGVAAGTLGLEPVMTLTTRILAIRRFAKGHRVGYGGTYTCTRDSVAAVLACGYGDGYPRHAPTGTPVRFAEGSGSLIGRVSMDSMVVDVTDLGEIDPVQRPVLWGRGLPVEEIAERAGTISYELFCRLAPRPASREVCGGGA